MSVERENAVINNQIILRNNFRFSQTSDLFDPYNISKVEILDSDGATVLQTFAGAEIIKDSTGKYHVVAGAITTAKTIYDKWYFSPSPGAIEITKTNTCVVWEAAAGAGEPEFETDPEALLAVVNNAIAARLSGGAVAAYSINGRNIQYISLSELRQMRQELQAQVSAAKGNARTFVSFKNPT
jgi:hypothetical protein